MVCATWLRRYNGENLPCLAEHGQRVRLEVSWATRRGPQSRPPRSNHPRSNVCGPHGHDGDGSPTCASLTMARTTASGSHGSGFASEVAGETRRGPTPPAGSNHRRSHLCRPHGHERDGLRTWCVAIMVRTTRLAQYGQRVRLRGCWGNAPGTATTFLRDLTTRSQYAELMDMNGDGCRTWCVAIM